MVSPTSRVPRSSSSRRWRWGGCEASCGARSGLRRCAWSRWRGPSDAGSASIFGPSLELWRAQWVYTLPFALAVGLEVLQANLHFYVVAARFDAAMFAVYAVGCLQIPLVDVMTTSSANVMMVKMAEEGFERRGGAALALWHDTMRRLALVIFPLVVFLLVMARDIIALLFTSRYLDSVPVFMLWTRHAPLRGAVRGRRAAGLRTDARAVRPQRAAARRRGRP